MMNTNQIMITEISKQKRDLDQLARQVQEAALKMQENNNGTDGGKFKLNYSKSTSIEKMKEGITQAEFTHWNKCVELHLESFVQRKGLKMVLRRMRQQTEEINGLRIKEIIEEVNSDKPGTIAEMYWRNGQYRERAHELYTFCSHA